MVIFLAAFCRKSYSEVIYVIKDGAYFCYCAYVLRISRYSVFLWVVPTNTRIFLRSLKLCGESRTWQVLLVSKKKIGVTMHFSEITLPQIGRKRHTMLCILPLLEYLSLNIYYLQKVRGYPQFSFWISIALAKICFPRIVTNRAKILRLLVGTVLECHYATSFL